MAEGHSAPVCRHPRVGSVPGAHLCFPWIVYVQSLEFLCVPSCAQPSALHAQVYSFPVYDMMESSLAKRSGKPPTRLMSMLIRSCYVIGTFIVAIIIPFFGDVL